RPHQHESTQLTLAGSQGDGCSARGGIRRVGERDGGRATCRIGAREVRLAGRWSRENRARRWREQVRVVGVLARGEPTTVRALDQIRRPKGLARNTPIRFISKDK